MVNATGWTELYDGNMLAAAYTMYTDAMGAWVITILFITYQMMLYLKTKNVTLMWVTGILFAVMYGTSTFIVPTALPIIIIILVFELGGILYLLLFK